MMEMTSRIILIICLSLMILSTVALDQSNSKAHAGPLPKSQMHKAVSSASDLIPSIAKGNKHQSCDMDLCTIGKQFCWHAQDGEDDRQCWPCETLQKTCAQQKDWEPKMKEKEAEISQLQKDNKVWKILAITFAVSTGCGTILLIALCCLLIKSKRAAPYEEEDAQILVESDDGSNALATVQLKDQPIENETAGTEYEQNGKEVTVSNSGYGEATVQVQEHFDNPRALCGRLRHVIPSADDQETACMVTSIS